METFCNRIASEVLFPKRAFLSRCDRQPDPQLVCDLAKAFNASISATAIRLTELTRASAFEVSGNQIPWVAGELRRAPSKRVLFAAHEMLTVGSEARRTERAVTYIPDARPVWSGP